LTGGRSRATAKGACVNITVVMLAERRCWEPTSRRSLSIGLCRGTAARAARHDRVEESSANLRCAPVRVRLSAGAAPRNRRPTASSTSTNTGLQSRTQSSSIASAGWRYRPHGARFGSRPAPTLIYRRRVSIAAVASSIDITGPVSRAGW